VGFTTAVRRRLGPFEHAAVDFYRARFLDLDDVATLARSLVDARRILEIGCGDGTLATRIAAAFPDAVIVGVDIAGEPGRLYTGDADRATFRSVPAEQLLEEGTEPFDLVLLVDVLHHVPPVDRADLLGTAHQLLKPGGLLFVKDWERGANAAHAMAYAADHYLSRAFVAFPTAPEMRAVVTGLFPDDEIVVEARVPPRRNNFALVTRRAA
jgi:2-polyprenyl-6-hydroxyphenyl methylase/3-demethylubiquinone-9 3-methyltransferase